MWNKYIYFLQNLKYKQIFEKVANIIIMQILLYNYKIMYFETFVGKDEQFYFNLRTETGVILKSEGYTAAANRDNGIESTKENSQDSARYEISDNHFNIKAGNGQVVATSLHFDASELEGIMKKVMQEAKNAPIQERV